MAFKGITWAGNIYQKFETMCLEVEEVMYEDTVKYMENQVQKVGVSVKKFYSEVMQDLLPPSCVDPVKSPGNLSLNMYPDTDIKKKPKLSVFDGQREVKRIDTEDEMVSGLATGEESCNSVHNEVNNLSSQHSNVLVENTASKSCSTKSRMGIHRRAVGIRRISQNNRPAKVSSVATSTSGHGSSKLSHDMNKASELDIVVRLPGEAINNKAITSDASLMSSSEKNISAESVHPNKDDSHCTLPDSDILLSDESQNQKKDNYVCMSSVRSETENFDSTSPVSNEFYSAESVRQMMGTLECTSPDSDEIKNAESARQKKYVSGCTSSSGSLPLECTSMSRDSSFSKLGSSIRSNNACEVECVMEGITTPNEGLSMKDDSFHMLSSSSDICDVKFADDFDMELIENDGIHEPRLEIFDSVERSKLEETCVLVEGDELHLAQGERIKKHKSFKKKIRKALSSKLRSPRKQDQLVPESKDPGEQKNSGVVVTMDSEKRKLQGHESLESDWELL